MGRIVGTSSAGAVGPMQFLPATWARCCTGDPLLPRDAIIGAATYLSQNGGPADMPAALHEYNPNDSYVATVTAFAENMRDNPSLFGAYRRVAGLLHDLCRHDPTARRLQPSAADRRGGVPRRASGRRRLSTVGTMADLLDISSRIIDSGVVDQMINRVTNELSELADDLAIVESFSHCVAFDSGDGLVCFDSSGVHTGEAVVAALKGWRPDRVSHLVYTHGHADHVGGSTYFAAQISRTRRSGTATSPHDWIGTTTRTTGTSSSTRASSAASPGELNLSIGEARGWCTSRRRRRRVASCPRTTLRPTETFELRSRHARRRHAHRAAPRPRRDRRSPVGMAPRTQVDHGRRLRDLELPQRRQPAEGAALSGRSGPPRCAR